MDLKSALEYAVSRSKASRCKDKQVGCVLLDKDWKVLSTGYNKSCVAVTVNGKCLKENDGVCEAIHAEVIAINGLYPNDKPYIAVCTLEPCFTCAQHLYARGVREVYFAQPTNPRKSGTWVFSQPHGKCIWEQVKDESLAELLSADTLMTMALIAEQRTAWNSIFDDIRKYHKDLGYPREWLMSSDITIGQKQQLRDMVLALTDEAHEALREADWKPWKKYNNEPKVNLDKFLEETGDILFFIDGMLMTFGLSWNDLAKAVKGKLKVDRDRMASGYHN